MIENYSHLIKGSSYANLFKALWATALARYITPTILTPVNSPWRFKHLTPKKLTALCDEGLLNLNKNSAYHITAKGRDLVKSYSQTYRLILIPEEYEGGGAHDLSVASVILSLIDQPHFYTVFYWEWKKPGTTERYLRPDAFVLFKNEDRVKLICLEVENPKGNWEATLSEKREKYETIARRPDTFHKWWLHVAKRFGFKLCDESEWGFSILCNSEICKDWRGWECLSI